MTNDASGTVTSHHQQFSLSLISSIDWMSEWRDDEDEQETNASHKFYQPEKEAAN